MCVRRLDPLRPAFLAAFLAAFMDTFLATFLAALLAVFLVALLVTADPQRDFPEGVVKTLGGKPNR